jgi:hypothetical protein
MDDAQPGLGFHDTSTTDVPIEGPPAHEEALAGAAPETVNLVLTYDEEDLKKLGEETYEVIEEDLRSSEKFREHRTSIVKLALGILPPRPEGHDTLAQLHWPIIITAITRIQSRMYDQQFPSNGEYFGAKPTDQNDLERTVRVSKHMNWQIEHQIEEYVPNHDAGMFQTLLYGSGFSIMYQSAEKNRPCHEFVATDDIILPYASPGQEDPHMADVPRITRVLRKYKHQLQKLAKSGYYDQATMTELFAAGAGTANVAGSNTGASTEKMTETIDKYQGVDKPKDTKAAGGARVLWECHCWGQLPKEEDERPLIVTIDRETKKVLSVILREDEDPVDRARFNREEAVAKASYEASMQKYEMDMQTYLSGQPDPSMAMSPMDPMGPGEMTSTMPPEPGETTSTEPPMPGEDTSSEPGVLPPEAPPMGAPGFQPPPTPPAPPPSPVKPKMIPINFFTHFRCMPNPEGIYGIGIGALLEGHNMAADVMGSQMIEAATLANTVTFLFSKQAKLSRGDFEIKPGQGNETDLSPQDVAKGIHIIQFPGANPALREFINDQKQEASELSGAGDILSGEVGGSNETATTTQIRIAQAMAQITIMNKRYTRARTAEGRNLARLNSVYLNDVEYFSVVDPLKGGAEGIQEMSVARADYLNDVDITVTADPRMASQPQRIAEANTALQAIITSPAPSISQNPVLLAAAYRRLFIAMDLPDLIQAIPDPNVLMQQMQQQPPPGAPPPAGPPAGQPGKTAPGGTPPTHGDAVGSGTPPARVPNAGPQPSNGAFAGQGG